MHSGEQSNLISTLDAAPLDFRYWWTFALLSAGFALEYFDFYVVGFLVAVLGPQWHLTYLQSAIILLSGGVGSIAGALSWGPLCDLLGRKKMILAGTFVCGISAAAVAFIPNGGWKLFALLRFGVGVGLSGAATAQIALLVEYTPTRFRTLLAGLPIVAATIGTLIASASAAVLLTRLGWRGIAAIGATPLVVGILIALTVPESVRWLVARGQIDKAGKAVRALTKTSPDVVWPQSATATRQRAPSFRDLYKQPSRFWLTLMVWFCASTTNYGVYLWGPTIVAMLLGIAVQNAAHYFVYVASLGVAGKLLFSFLPNRIGRHRAGELHGYGIAITLAAVAIFRDHYIHGFPVFVPLLALGAIFFDGQFCNITPYTAEIFPVGLAGRGTGLAQAANGLGKIVGPLCLALIAGAHNLVTPQATSNAIFPAFMFLAFCGLVIGLCFTFLGVETRGKPLALSDSAAQSAAIDLAD